jgi:transmembrane sensor
VTPAPPVVEILSSAEIAQRLAWRVPRLEFTRTPLAEAVPMINQHSTIKLSLADEALGRVLISGLLRVDNIETLFRLLELEHGIKAERRGVNDVVLSRNHSVPANNANGRE